jgi:hypothetical protein
MTINYKVLGQINPTANVLTTLYTVPSGNSAVISTISVCNQTATATTFDLAIKPGNASIESKHYVNFRTPLPASDTVFLTLGITLAATDVIAANAATNSVSFNAFGSEIY